MRLTFTKGNTASPFDRIILLLLDLTHSGDSACLNFHWTTIILYSSDAFSMDHSNKSDARSTCSCWWKLTYWWCGVSSKAKNRNVSLMSTDTLWPELAEPSGSSLSRVADACSPSLSVTRHAWSLRERGMENVPPASKRFAG